MKSVIAHGVLALLGLIWAYETYNREPEADEQEQKPAQAVVLQCEEPQLTRVSLETPSHNVSIVPKRTAAGPEYWMTSQRKKVEPKDGAGGAGGGGAGGAGAAGAAALGAGGAGGAGGQGGAGVAAAGGAGGAGGAGPEAPKPEADKEPRKYDPDAPVEFVANPKFDEVVKWAAPLTAVRALGKVDKSQFAEFGLDKVGTFLRVECGGKKVQLDVGGRTFGAGDQYARDAQTGEVYLLEGKKIMDLQSAQFRFMQSELHNFTLADVDTAVITGAGKTRSLSQRNRQSKEEARWVDAAEPDKRNELFGNWFERVWRMRGKLFLKDGQQPGQELQVTGSAPKPVVTIEYSLEGKKKGKVEIVRVDTTTKLGNLYYARSEATHRWVALDDSIAKQVEDDGGVVTGAEEAPEGAESRDPNEGLNLPKQAAPGGPYGPAGGPHGGMPDPHGGMADPHGALRPSAPAPSAKPPAKPTVKPPVKPPAKPTKPVSPPAAPTR